MNDPQHTIQDGTRQVVVRQIGDVTVTLDMPEGAPVPKVALLIHSHQHDYEARVIACEALGLLDEEHLNEVGPGSRLYWYTREEDGIEATVWFERDRPTKTEEA